MRLLIFLTFTATVLSGTGVKAGQNYTCPETDMQFGQDFIDEVVGVADWHGCGEKLLTICDIKLIICHFITCSDHLGKICEMVPNCLYWSLGPANGHLNICFLMREEGKLSNATGWFSGPTGCL